MKRISIRTMWLSLASGLLLNFATPAHSQIYSVVTGPTGGPMFAISGAWADLVTRDLKGYQLTNQVGGGSVYTMKILAQGQADFAMVGNDVALAGYNGQDAFAGAPVKDARAVAALYMETFQIVTLASSPIKTIGDLKGKRIAVGPPASGTQLASNRIFPVLGLTGGTDFKKLELGFNESADYLRDGNTDAAAYQTGLPYGPILDVSVSKPVHVLCLPADTIEKITKTYPFYVAADIPKTTYKGMESDCKSVAVKMLLLASSKVSNDDVYKMTKLMFDNIDRVRASHKAGESISPQKALEGITVPLHPGAEKFYREKGYLK